MLEKLLDLKHNKITQEPQTACNYITTKIDLAEIVDLSWGEYYKEVEKYVDNIMPLIEFDRSVIIADIVDNEMLTFEDVEHFNEVFAAVLCKRLRVDGFRYSEKRLGTELKCNCNYCTLMDLVNYKTKINVFNVKVKWGEICFGLAR